MHGQNHMKFEACIFVHNTRLIKESVKFSALHPCVFLLCSRT